MLPKQSRGTFRKLFTKPSEQVSAPPCRLYGESLLTVFLRGVDADGRLRALEDLDDLGEALALGDLGRRLVLLVLHLAVAARLEQHARQLTATHRRGDVQRGVAVLGENGEI